MVSSWLCEGRGGGVQDLVGLLSEFSRPGASTHTADPGAGVAQCGQGNRLPGLCVRENFIQLIAQLFILAKTLDLT